MRTIYGVIANAQNIYTIRESRGAKLLWWGVGQRPTVLCVYYKWGLCYAPTVLAFVRAGVSVGGGANKAIAYRCAVFCQYEKG